jgi:hypothetical protein
MLEMGTSGLMSGVGKRGDALAPAPASGLDSTDLPGIPVFEIWSTFEAINVDYYYEAGPLAPAYMLRFDEFHNPEEVKSWLRSHFEILIKSNLAYAQREMQIENGIRALLNRRYPR